MLAAAKYRGGDADRRRPGRRDRATCPHRWGPAGPEPARGQGAGYDPQRWATRPGRPAGPEAAAACRHRG